MHALKNCTELRAQSLMAAIPWHSTVQCSAMKPNAKASLNPSLIYKNNMIQNGADSCEWTQATADISSFMATRVKMGTLMMEAVYTSETWSVSTRQQRGTDQKTATFTCKCSLRSRSGTIGDATEHCRLPRRLNINVDGMSWIWQQLRFPKR